MNRKKEGAVILTRGIIQGYVSDGFSEERVGFGHTSVPS